MWTWVCIRAWPHWPHDRAEDTSQDSLKAAMSPSDNRSTVPTPSRAPPPAGLGVLTSLLAPRVFPGTLLEPLLVVQDPQGKAGHKTVSGSWALTYTQIRISSLRSPLPYCYSFLIKTLRVNKQQTKICPRLRFIQELCTPLLPPSPSLPIICI